MKLINIIRKVPLHYAVGFTVATAIVVTTLGWSGYNEQQARSNGSRAAFETYQKMEGANINLWYVIGGLRKAVDRGDYRGVNRDLTDASQYLSTAEYLATSSHNKKSVTGADVTSLDNAVTVIKSTRQTIQRTLEGIAEEHSLNTDQTLSNLRESRINALSAAENLKTSAEGYSKAGTLLTGLGGIFLAFAVAMAAVVYDMSRSYTHKEIRTSS